MFDFGISAGDIVRKQRTAIRQPHEDDPFSDPAENFLAGLRPSASVLPARLEYGGFSPIAKKAHRITARQQGLSDDGQIFVRRWTDELFAS